MIVDFSKKLTTPEGECYNKPPVKMPNGELGPVVLADMRWFCMKALLDAPSNEKATGEERFNRALLARQIKETQTKLDLKPEDAALLKACVGETYPGWVVLQIWPELDSTLETKIAAYAVPKPLAELPAPVQPTLPAPVAAPEPAAPSAVAAAAPVVTAAAVVSPEGGVQ